MKIRKLLTFALIASASATAWAVPAKRTITTLPLESGETIEVAKQGDENGSFYTDRNGQNYRLDAQGTLQPLDNAALAAKRSKSRARSEERRAVMRRSQVPNNGSPRVPILLVQYKDIKFKDGANADKTFTDFYTSGAKSALKYFSDQSNGKYTPQFDIYGPITLSGNRVVYGGNDSDDYDKGVGNMVGEACNALNADIDFSRYDNDDDGECDVVIVLYAGVGEASSEVAESVWPCQWELSDSEYGRALRLDGVKVDKFAVFNELNGEVNKIDGIGTFCHEFSHCLGLPDFYDTQYSGHWGMGPWSLMDYGSYNDDGYTPIGYSAYEKEFMGWLEIPDVAENQFITLPVFNSGSVETDKAYRLVNARDKNEYYLIENRACQGWDRYIEDEGMMVTHVTYSAAAWEQNIVNDYSPQRMTIIPNDGVLSDATTSGDLWPHNSRNELTDTSSPAAKVNTGSYLGKPMTEITRNSDGTISLWVMKAPLPVLSTPHTVSFNITGADSFAAAWNHDAEFPCTYTIHLMPHVDIKSETLYDLNLATDKIADWTTTGYTIVEDAGYRLGSSKQQGSVTTPGFASADYEQVSVVFNGAYYGTDGSSVKVSLTDSKGNDVASETVALESSYKDYRVKLPVSAEGTYKVKFATIANKKRVMLREVRIYLGEEPDGALEAPAYAAAYADQATFEKILHEGITEMRHEYTGLDLTAAMDFQIRAIPVDATQAEPSKWSAKIPVTFAQTAIGSVDEEEVEVWYTTDGLRLETAPSAAGIYIRKQGRRTHKEIIR